MKRMKAVIIPKYHILRYLEVGGEPIKTKEQIFNLPLKQKTSEVSETSEV